MDKETPTNDGKSDATEAVAMIQKGLGKRRVTPPPAMPSTTPETPPSDQTEGASPDDASIGDTPADAGRSPAQEIADLKKRLADMEAQSKQRTAMLDGEYTKAKYISEEHAKWGLPVPLLDGWLPATTDKTELYKSVRELREYIKQHNDFMKVHRPDFGAVANGGSPPNQVSFSKDAPATSQIADGLRRRPTR